MALPPRTGCADMRFKPTPESIGFVHTKKQTHEKSDKWKSRANESKDKLV